MCIDVKSTSTSKDNSKTLCQPVIPKSRNVKLNYKYGFVVT